MSHPPLGFTNNAVMQATSLKHLRVILDTRLSFEKQKQYCVK